jgi:hypothetical protein
MNGLQLELEQLRRQNQETAQYACLLADAFGERLSPTVLQDVQTAVRQNLRYVEDRLNSLEWRRRRWLEHPAQSGCRRNGQHLRCGDRERDTTARGV